MKEKKELNTAILLASILLLILIFNQFYITATLYRSKRIEWQSHVDSVISSHLQELTKQLTKYNSHSASVISPRDNNSIHVFSYLLTTLDSLVQEDYGEYAFHFNYIMQDSLDRQIAIYPTSRENYFPPNILSSRFSLNLPLQASITIHYNYPFSVFIFENGREITFLFTLLLFSITCLTFIIHSYHKQYRYSEKQENMMLQIIHDVKHPLVNIDMYTDLIKEDSIAPSDLEGTKHVQVIQENIIRLKESIQSLLCKVTTLHEVHIKKEVFNFQEELDKIIQGYNYNSKVHFTLDYQLPLSIINASRIHLTNAIANLLDNAGKYTFDGDNVHIRCYSSNTYIHIDIQDHGPGIPSDKQSLIFKKYYRNEALRKVGKAKGYGLGLPYVQQVVKGHHGNITLESVPGKGCLFKIVLPKDFIYGK